MTTDSLYLVLAEKKQEDCIRPKMKNKGNDWGKKIGQTVSLLLYPGISYPECALTSTKKRHERTRIFEKRAQMYEDVMSS